MMIVRNALSGFMLLFAVSSAFAQGSAIVQSPAQPPVRPADPPRPPQATPPAPRPPAPPAAPPGVDRPPQVQSAPSSNEASSQPILSSAPRMIGDFPGYCGTSTVVVHSTLTQIIPVTIPPPPPPPNGNGNGNGNGSIGNGNANASQLPQIVLQERRVGDLTETFKFCTLALSRGAFKIAENESPQPQDRFYVTYNNFHNVAVQSMGASGYLTPTGSTAQLPLRTTLANTLTQQGGQPITLTNVTVDQFDVHRETVGFEKTFLDGTASVGLRMPIFQTTQDAGGATVNAGQLAGFSTLTSNVAITSFSPGFGGSRVGDLSIILKYAMLDDIYGRGLVSGGLVVTTPTGGGIPLENGEQLYSVLMQPYLGYVRLWDRFYAHGFTSVAVPTDDRDITIAFNDIGAGYFVYRNPEARFLTSIAPTIETHVSTPLTSGKDGISAIDVVTMTGGLNFGLGQHAVLTFGVATPVTGPKLNQIESAVQFNWIF